MTVLEAYKVLGWPPEGDVNRFILPAEGAVEPCRAWICPHCGGKGWKAVECWDISCPLCNFDGLQVLV